MACCRTRSSDTSGAASSTGLRKGASAPSSMAASRISGLSVETTTRFTDGESMAASIGYARSCLPPNTVSGLTLRSRSVALAGTIATTLNSSLGSSVHRPIPLPDDRFSKPEIELAVDVYAGSLVVCHQNVDVAADTFVVEDQT